MSYQEWYDDFSKNNIDPNEISANTFGRIIWDIKENKLSQAQAEIAELEKLVQEGLETISSDVKEIEQLKEELRLERECVDFYADKKNWNLRPNRDHIDIVDITDIGFKDLTLVLKI